MTRKFRFSLLLTLAFLSVAIILYVLDLKITANASKVSFIPYESWSFVTLSTLYGFTLFLFINISNSYKAQLWDLDKKLAATTESLNEVQSSLDYTVEKDL